mmetsp:Transcript_15299/g.36100  ORF Transcript_15299/g.36100 Transcript_15299/m.36100 type:complete len:295 (+) Transcript_15299:383-1267(+)
MRTTSNSSRISAIARAPLCISAPSRAAKPCRNSSHSTLPSFSCKSTREAFFEKRSSTPSRKAVTLSLTLLMAVRFSAQWIVVARQTSCSLWISERSALWCCSWTRSCRREAMSERMEETSFSVSVCFRSRSRLSVSTSVATTASCEFSFFTSMRISLFSEWTLSTWTWSRASWLSSFSMWVLLVAISSFKASVHFSRSALVAWAAVSLAILIWASSFSTRSTRSSKAPSCDRENPLESCMELTNLSVSCTFSVRILFISSRVLSCSSDISLKAARIARIASCSGELSNKQRFSG